MATATLINLEQYVQEITAYWDKLPVYPKTIQGIKKSLYLKTAKLNAFRIAYAHNNDEQVIAKAAHLLKYDVEKELREIAKGEEKKEKKKEEYNKSKKSKIVRVTEKGTTIVQSNTNTGPKSTVVVNSKITRGGNLGPRELRPQTHIITSQSKPVQNSGTSANPQRDAFAQAINQSSGTQLKPPAIGPSSKVVTPPSPIIPKFRNMPVVTEREEITELIGSSDAGEDRRAVPGNNRGDGNGGRPTPQVRPNYAAPSSTPPVQPDYDDNDTGSGQKGNRKKRKNPLGNKIGSKLRNKLGSGLGRGGGALTKTAGQTAARGLFATPVGWGILAVIIIILIVLFIVYLVETNEKNNPAGAAETLTISKTGPATGKLNDVLTYTITLNDTVPSQEITVIDHLPDGVSLVPTDVISSWTKMTFDPAQKTITWKATENTPKGGLFTGNNTTPLTLTVKYKVTKGNTNLVTWAEANATRASGGSGTYQAPLANTCGKYKFTAPLKMNFGDPTCTMDKNKLNTMLQEMDPANASVWFNKIIPCESGYNPNAYAGPQTGTPDARGAWGLYQMGSASPPGAPPPAPGKNGPNDRGDVNWEIQTENATTYGKKIGSLGRYWACAR